MHYITMVVWGWSKDGIPLAISSLKLGIFCMVSKMSHGASVKLGKYSSTKSTVFHHGYVSETLPGINMAVT